MQTIWHKMGTHLAIAQAAQPNHRFLGTYIVLTTTFMKSRPCSLQVTRRRQQSSHVEHENLLSFRSSDGEKKTGEYEESVTTWCNNVVNVDFVSQSLNNFLQIAKFSYIVSHSMPCNISPKSQTKAHGGD